MWETRYYILLQRGHPTSHISAQDLIRLVTICRQLCAEKRHSEALEVARLRKRMLLTLNYGTRCNPCRSLEDAVFLSCLEAMLVKVEDLYGAAGHAHGHIDARVMQFQLRLLQPSTTINGLYREATDLISCYDDADYPNGALFVLRLVLTWKSKRHIAFTRNDIALVRSLESLTGQLLPLAELESIPLSQNSSGARHHLPVAQTNMTGRERLTDHGSQPNNRQSPVDYAINRNSMHSRPTDPDSSSKTSRNPFSRFVRFVRGDFSEERLSAHGPLSLLETLLLSLNLSRSAL